MRRLVCAAVVLALSIAGPGIASAQESANPATAAPPAVAPYRSELFDTAGQTVDQIIQLGRSRRPALRAERLQVDIAEGARVQAGLRPNPELETVVGPPGIFGETNKQEFEVGVAQRFELGGKRTRRIDVAEAETERARAGVDAVLNRFSADVRGAVARAQGADRLLAAYSELVRLNDDLARLTRARLAEGDASGLDLALIEQESDRLRVQMIEARASLAVEVAGIRELVGLAPGEALVIAPLPESPPLVAQSADELSLLARQSRPELIAARAAEKAAAARLRLAEAGRTPDVVASVRYSTSTLHNVESGAVTGTLPERTLRFGISIEIPVANRNQGEILSSVAARSQALAEREAVEATITRDVADAFARYRAASESLTLYATAMLPRQRRALASVRQAYGLGGLSVFDVLAEQRRTVEIETAYAAALRDTYAALAVLEAAVGAPLVTVERVTPPTPIPAPPGPASEGAPIITPPARTPDGTTELKGN
jgi:cobalt-zinc-cadmium efflux system outer membrane protein